MKDKHMVIYSNYYNEEMWNDVKKSLMEQNEEFGERSKLTIAKFGNIIMKTLICILKI